jgi:hypothetical protein
MDESVRRNIERIQKREVDADYSIGLIEFYYGSRLKTSFVDLINYVYEKAIQGVMKLRVKELLIEEVLEREIETIMCEDFECKDGEINE